MGVGRILTFIFLYKHISAFHGQSLKSNILIYSPLIIYFIIYLFNLNGFFFYENKLINFNFTFYPTTTSYYFSKDIFVSLELITLYFVFLFYFLYKKIKIELDEIRKSCIIYKKWIYVIYYFIISTSLLGFSKGIMIVFSVDFLILNLLNSILFVISFLLLLFFTKYLDNVVNLKKIESRSEDKKNERKFLSIKNLLIKNEMFLNPSKNLSHLVIQTKISNKKISKLIYDFESLSVHNYLNKHRIIFAKAKIKDGYLSTFSVEALCNESGFRSPQPFYIAFKKFTGKTPSEYHKSIMKASITKTNEESDE